MAGTLTISTLSDGTNSTSSTNCIQGSAKAWVNFNASSGTSAVIRTSYNVSSVTYNATGDYTINFTNAFADANYSWFTATSADFGSDWLFANINTTSGSATESAPTTTSCRMQLYGRASTTHNSKYVNATFFR